MVFVNDLSGATGLPWWTYHMPENANGMTYVDVVFPAFLFIVGMSIPLAIQRRLAKGQSLGEIWGHILVRSLSLMTLGLFLANAEKIDPKWMGAHALLYTLLAFFGALVLWSAYPASPKYRTLYRALKFSGLLALLWFAISYRRGAPDGHVAWLDFSYWEILGLIGGAYLTVSTLYLVLRKHVLLLATSLVVLSALNTFFTIGWLKWLTHFPGYYSSPFAAGLSSIAMAGLLLSVVFFEAPFATRWKSRVSGHSVMRAFLPLRDWRFPDSAYLRYWTRLHGAFTARQSMFSSFSFYIGSQMYGITRDGQHSPSLRARIRCSPIFSPMCSMSSRDSRAFPPVAPTVGLECSKPRCLRSLSSFSAPSSPNGRFGCSCNSLCERGLGP